MREADDWRRLMSLDAATSLTVYLDMKSPHAYIAVRPTLEVARDYRIKVDFRPYTLSYKDLGLTTKVESDNRRIPASAAADRKARMYYAAGRQYATLQRIPFRSPHRLLDSDLAHRAFLFAKHQALEVPFMMGICLRGWGSGWRDVELESLEQLRNALKGLGADLDGFEEFVGPGGPGERELVQSMESADASGFVGAPHYVFHDEVTGRQVGLFGREHLALIRTKFSARGLARHADVQPDFSHAWCGPLT
jgi:2-hydroxychromene-2-carboxylate isomerase